MMIYSTTPLHVGQDLVVVEHGRFLVERGAVEGAGEV